MKREPRLLLDRAIDSLVLSIEHFNRPSDRGRVTTVLIILDHAFEMLLKAAILHKGGKIREPRKRETIGFDACVRKAYSDGEIQFLTDEQVVTLQALNGQRDAAQHHLIDISEQQLYMHAQSGVTLFRDLLKAVFDFNLGDYLPARVLPVSTVIPTTLDSLFDSEVSEIAKLLAPGRRRKTEALTRIRPLAILDATIRGEKVQPSDSELRHVAADIAAEKSWGEIFSGVASVDLKTDGEGPTINLRFSKKEGILVHAVPEGTPGASVVGIKRVDELGFYNLGHAQLAEKVGLNRSKTSALIWHLKLSDDPECFREITIGKSKFKRYSQKAIDRLNNAQTEVEMGTVWASYQAR